MPPPPSDWIRLDRRFAFVDVVPSSGPALVMSGLVAFLLNKVAGGRGVPQSILIDYKTGFTTALLEAQHQDLLKGVRLRTILSVFGIVSAFLSPAGAISQSLSLDGLTRSQGFGGKYGPYTGAILRAVEEEEQIRASWKSHEKGVAYTML